MARLKFRKPKIAVLISEVIALTIWLFLGDRVIDVLDGIIGGTYDLNLTTDGSGVTSVSGCTNDSIFEDSFEILGIGYACGDHTASEPLVSVANADDGLLGVVGLVMVVMILMNFVTYS